LGQHAVMALGCNGTTVPCRPMTAGSSEHPAFSTVRRSSYSASTRRSSGWQGVSPEDHRAHDAGILRRSFLSNVPGRAADRRGTDRGSCRGNNDDEVDKSNELIVEKGSNKKRTSLSPCNGGQERIENFGFPPEPVKHDDRGERIAEKRIKIFFQQPVSAPKFHHPIRASPPP